MLNTYFAADETAMVAFGGTLADALSGHGVVFLQGDLGMGKTTMCRGVLQHFGHIGAVKSPTYTLVEPYELPQTTVYHFDLYRLGDPEELEFLGIRDYFSDDALCMIEWPDKGTGVLPQPDLEVSIEVENAGRRISWRAASDSGVQAAQRLAEKLAGV